MWSLRQRQDGTFYLTYDRSRRYNYKHRGIWEYVGPRDSAYTNQCIRINKSYGYLVANDDEGGVRVLVLE